MPILKKKDLDSAGLLANDHCRKVSFDSWLPQAEAKQQQQSMQMFSSKSFSKAYHEVSSEGNQKPE